MGGCALTAKFARLADGLRAEKDLYHEHEAQPPVFDCVTRFIRSFSRASKISRRENLEVEVDRAHHPSLLTMHVNWRKLREG